MIPLRDENPARRPPIVTVLLLAAIGFVYFSVLHSQPDRGLSVSSCSSKLPRRSRLCRHPSDERADGKGDDEDGAGERGCEDSAVGRVAGKVA